MQPATQMGGSPLQRMGAAQQGGGPGAQQQQQSPDPQQMLQMYQQKIQSLAQLAGEIMQLQAVIDPEGQALLVPIAQGGKALEARIQEIAQRAQAGPGAPGGAQASGGGSPAPNPDEGAAPAAMAA